MLPKTIVAASLTIDGFVYARLDYYISDEKHCLGVRLVDDYKYEAAHWSEGRSMGMEPWMDTVVSMLTIELIDGKMEEKIIIEDLEEELKIIALKDLKQGELDLTIQEDDTLAVLKAYSITMEEYEAAAVIVKEEERRKA